MNMVSNAINEVWDSIHAVMQGFWLQLERGKVVRRIMLGLAAYLQYETMVWAMNYISNLPAEVDTVGAAALVAAVLTPASALFAAAIKFYGDTRKNEPVQ